MSLVPPVRRSRRTTLIAGAVIPLALLAACSRGSEAEVAADPAPVDSVDSAASVDPSDPADASETTGDAEPAAGNGRPGVEAACPDVLAEAEAAVAAARDTSADWSGPTEGPAAQEDKSIVYVAADLTNPGVTGVADGVEEAAAVIGWEARVIDGQGTPAGQQAAFSQALTLNPDAIIIGGFDPLTTQAQLDQAEAAGIPVAGWHAVGAPGPSENPNLFTNVTTRVEDVALISAQWIIVDSGGTAGAVIFTDASIPFAKGKSDMIQAGLEACESVEVLSTENIPIPDAATRTPQEVSTLLGEYDTDWTHSVAINDLYYDNAAPALRSAGREGTGAPFNVGAGDGSAAAFDRIRNGEFQTVTVPEPLNEQGWQLVDELNRALAGEPATDYVAPVHVTDTTNAEDGDLYDPDSGYRDIYTGIWGT